MGQYVEFYGGFKVNKEVDMNTCKIIKVLQEGNENKIKSLKLPEMPDGSLSWTFSCWEFGGSDNWEIGVYGESTYKCYFNNYYPQLKYLVENVFIPRGYILNGEMHIESEDGKESYLIEIKNNELSHRFDNTWRCEFCGKPKEEFRDELILADEGDEDFCQCEEDSDINAINSEIIEIRALLTLTDDEETRQMLKEKIEKLHDKKSRIVNGGLK